MRHRRAPALLVLFVASLSYLPRAAASDAPAVSQIVDRYIEALGGRDRWAAIESIRLSGTYMFNGESFPFTISRRRPDRFRLQIALQDQDSVEASNGRVSWRTRVRPGSSPLVLEADAATRFEEEWADFDGPLIDYRQKGHRVEWVGWADVDGVECHHLQLHLASGNRQHWYLDKETYTLVRKVTSQVHPRRGPYDRLWYFDSWRTVDGLSVPEFFEREDLQFVRAYEVTEVEFNVEVPEALFSPPRR